MADTEEVYDAGGFLFAVFLSKRQLSRRCHDDIKVSFVQYQDLDVRLISQIDIVMCFFYNISAIHTDIEDDVTPISSQYQNVHWERTPSVTQMYCKNLQTSQETPLLEVFEFEIGLL